MKKPNIHKGKWIACYDVPAAAIEGHIIKANNAAKTPIASLWVGGGTHGKPVQRATTKAIAALPDLLSALEKTLLDLEDFVNPAGDYEWSNEAGRDMVRRIKLALIKAGYTP